MRELNERLDFGDRIVQPLADSRRGKNTQHPLADLLRQSIYGRMAGYEDVNAVLRRAREGGAVDQGQDDPAQLPSVPFQRNARLWLSLVPHNLGNLWRRLVLPMRIDNLSLTICSNGW